MVKTPFPFLTIERPLLTISISETPLSHITYPEPFELKKITAISSPHTLAPTPLAPIPFQPAEKYEITNLPKNSALGAAPLSPGPVT